jgi:hypothetical protein
LPISINRLKNDELKKIIVCCLKPETERPSADTLLDLPYLNELENEENNRPVELWNINEIIIEVENSFSNSSLSKESSYLNLENIEERKIDKERKQTASNDGQNIPNFSTSTGNFFTRNSLLNKEKDPPIMITSKNISKNRPKEISINTNFNSNGTHCFLTNTNPSTPNNLNSSNFSFNQLNQLNSFQSTKQTLNPIIERRGSTIGLLNKNMIRPNSSNSVTHNSNPCMGGDQKLHKVSLKNSLNLNQNKVNFLKFEVNIQMSPQSTGNMVSSSQTPIFQSSQILSSDKNELEIMFIVHRGDWTNGKSKIYI